MTGRTKGEPTWRCFFLIDLTTYALLRKQITTAASGVSDVRAEGDELVFVLADGHEVRMAIPATEIRDAVVRDDVLVLTLEDDKEIIVDATLTQSGQAADAKVTGDVVSQLKDDMTSKADKAALTRTDRSLDALWKLNQGISYDFQTDAAAAYAKQVPSGAKLASVESVGGKTVVWNQGLKNRTFDNTSNWYKEDNVSFSVDNNVASVNSAIATNGIYQPIDNLKVSHKYYMSVELKSNIENFKVIYGSNDVTNIYISQIITANWCKYCGMKTCNIEKNILFIYSSTNGTFDVRNPLLIDLTQLFGSGNEPTDISDSRIAWIEAYASAHPEYNAGELVSADVDSVKYNDAIVAAIPSTVRALPGYGWSAGSVYNSIERTESGWKYIQRVGSVDLGTLEFFDGVLNNVSYFGTSTIASLIKKPSNNAVANILTKIYKTIYNGSGVLGLKDKTIFVWTNGSVYLR